jgi:hypothetical protein
MGRDAVAAEAVAAEATRAERLKKSYFMVILILSISTRIYSVQLLMASLRAGSQGIDLI